MFVLITGNTLYILKIGGRGRGRLNVIFICVNTVPVLVSESYKCMSAYEWDARPRTYTTVPVCGERLLKVLLHIDKFLTFKHITLTYC